MISGFLPMLRISMWASGGIAFINHVFLFSILSFTKLFPSTSCLRDAEARQEVLGTSLVFYQTK